MKKFLKGFAVLVVVFFAAPFVLYSVASAASFVAFYFPRAEINTDACSHYYVGANKGIIWSRGEWHHYVDFKVDASSQHKNWEMVDAPLPSTIWESRHFSPDTIRVSYRWPSNWRDPFPTSDWKICSLSS